MKTGGKTSTPCNTCGRDIYPAEVVGYSERDLIFWFLTGICRNC